MKCEPQVASHSTRNYSPESSRSFCSLRRSVWGKGGKEDERSEKHGVPPSGEPGCSFSVQGARHPSVLAELLGPANEDDKYNL